MTAVDIAGYREKNASSSQRIVHLAALMLAAFFVWAYSFEIAEVSSGSGTVVPISREQIIQSLEGGIVASLRVREGDIVEPQQLLAQLDPTRSASNVGETAARYYASLAAAARLRAEVEGEDTVSFPQELDEHPDLKASEEALFRSRRQSMEQALAGLVRERDLLSKEVEITRSLEMTGAASTMELIRLERQQAQIEKEIAKVQFDYVIQSREELSRMSADTEVQAAIMRGRTDQLTRLTLRSPVRGIVKDVAVTTIGGVVPPNGELMTIVPLGDQLMIEARISPRDIAFIHPGQTAMVKISAYDFAIYGGLEGTVVSISPNTVRDEVKPEQYYYRVFIRTERDTLVNKLGKTFPIVPGMIATVDIQTGSKTVWEYLIKPFNRAQEALRER